MGEAAKVEYNGFQFGQTDSFPIPLVSVGQEYVMAGERWTMAKRISLNGEIIGCTKSDLVASQNELLFYFADDFKTLEISGLDNITLAKVISVNFEGSDYLAAISYSIELEAYDFDEFSTTNYVVDPVDSISMQEEGDKSLTITHTISAKGVNSGSYNALTNAKNFVQAQLNSQKTAGTWPVPNLINSKDPNYKRLLVSVSEDIDRIQGTYGITKTYKSDLDYERGDILLRYTKDITEQEGQFKIFNFQGSVEGGIDSSLDFEDVRNRFRNFKTSLNTEFLHELIGSLSITEDVAAGRLEFSISYSSRKQEVIDDYDISVSETSDTALISVSVQGQMSAMGPIGIVAGTDCRYRLVEKTFDETKYYDVANEVYKAYLARHSITVPSSVILNEAHLSSEITHNKFDGSISYSFQFSDRISHGYRNLDYTLNCQPSLQAIAVDALVDGGHAFYDLGFRGRAKFGVNGTSLGEGDDLIKFAGKKFAKFCGGGEKIVRDFLIEEESGTSDEEKNKTFNKTWSFHSPNFTIDTSVSYVNPADGDGTLLM